MKKFSIALFILVYSVIGSAQLNLNITDTTVCNNTPFQVCANIPPSSLSGLNFDDRFSSIINIGFPFNYFGTNYSQCLISENNFITFNTNFAGQLSSNYTYPNSLNANELNKAILFPYQDLDVSFGGVIRYMTVGQAPNRKFIVEFCTVAYFSNPCHNINSRNQLILYETSNVIEMHLGIVSYCTNWPNTGPNGHAVEGILNGSNTFFVPNRGPGSTPWTVSAASPSAHRFTPSSTTNYSISSIPYNPSPFILTNQGNYTWYAGNSTTPFASGACAMLVPDTAVNYFVVKYTGPLGCGSTTNSTIFDTVNVHYTVPFISTALSYCASQLPTIWNGITIPANAVTNPNYDTVFVSNAPNCDTNFIINLTILPGVTPSFTPVAPICQGAILTALPTTSTNGITGTWSPALNNTTTTTYTFTPSAGQCASLATLQIVVTPIVTPTFSPVTAICSGGALNPLPTTSLNGFTGSWSPALNNLATTTYTFTPSNAGQCAANATLTIVVNPIISPTFLPVAAICQGASLAALPTTSTNGVSGTWSPVLNNNSTTTYTFTPNAGQCATATTMVINVNPVLLPTFNPIGAVCQGTVLAALPTTSLNGVTGTWSPAINNTTTTTYTFTPSAGQCASQATMQIVVNPSVIATFSPVAAICSGGTLNPLPTTSLNGITGSWNPALNNLATTTYTFTPNNAGQCAANVALTIAVNPIISPTFTPIAAICQGAALAALPTTSINGVTGTWSPAINNTATTTYTFTPGAGQCANGTTMVINVNPILLPAFALVGPVCQGTTLPALPTTSINGVQGTWSPAINNTTTTTYTFTPSAGQCASQATLQIVINPSTTPTFSPIAAMCAGSILNPLPTTSLNGITGSWNPAMNNLATTTYTFTPNAGQNCPTSTTMQIVVNPYLIGTRYVTICQGGSYVFNGVNYSTTVAGVKDTLPNINTCDSIITLNLTVHPNTLGIQQATICDGSSYTFNGTAFSTNNNTAKDTLTNQWGCDSIVTLNLTVLPVNPVTSAVSLTGCGVVNYSNTNYFQDTNFVDTITNTFGCDSLYKNVSIIVFPQYQYTETIDTTGCETVKYEDSIYANSYDLIQQFKTINGCDSLTRTINIHVLHFVLSASFSPDAPYAGEQITINTSANTNNYNIISWQPSTLFSNQSAKFQNFSMTTPDLITIIGESGGCYDTVVVNVGDLPTYSTDVKMPNAFSPNGDGRNDVFRPVFKIDRAYSIVEFWVYNRYGQIIYSSGNSNAGWDGYFKGKLQDQGVYYYSVKIRFLDNVEKTFIGDVTLIR